jgi:hypothetical protein
VSSDAPKHWLEQVPWGFWMVVGSWLIASCFAWQVLLFGPGAVCVLIGACKWQDQINARRDAKNRPGSPPSTLA